MATLTGASLLLLGAPAASSLARAPARQAPAPPQAASPSAARALAAARAVLPASSPAARALAAARTSGKPVAIPAATTQTSSTVANPDGTFATTTYPAPVRVQVGGVWTPTNATLRRNQAGTWSPAAVPNGLVLSGGGTGPLATFSSPAGGSLAISFPGRLPVPQVSGATATYPSVLPGVDLQVTATKLGGLSEVLIVRDSAAASPALRRLRLPVRTGSLTLAADTHGNLAATGPGGLTEFTSPTPFAWDSATTATSSTAHGTAANPALGRHISSASGPARGAHFAPVTRTVSGGALVMDTAAVAPAWTAYPAYIATSIAPAVLSAPPKPITALSSTSISTTALATFNNTEQGGEDGWDEAQQGCPYTKNWDVKFTYGNGVGYQDYGGGCDGLYRSFYRISSTNLTSAMHVQKATFYISDNYGADWTCSDKWSVTLHLTDSFGSSADWANQPAIGKNDQARTDHVEPGPNPNSSCSKHTVSYNVTYAMTLAAANTWNHATFGLYGDETISSTNYGFMRFGDYPHVTTVYDLTPPVPTNTVTSPAAHFHPGGTASYGCTSSGPYPWIGKTDLTGGNGSDLTLSADVAPAISGEQVRGVFHMWDSNGEISGYPQDSSFVTGAHTATHQIGFALTDGQLYGWNAQANVDGNGTDTNSSGYTSARSSPYCHFNVDLTAPTVPGVSSADFPPSGSSTGTSLHVGDSGSFTFSSTDPPPANCTSGPCAASGVYEFQYSLNSPIPTSGANAITAATSNGVATASVNLTPQYWGTNTLYVDAVDAAGNVSQTYQYDFYVPWNPTTTVNPGDINGDHIPDLLVTAGNGDLVMYPGNTDPSATPVTVGQTANSPDGTGWNTFQVTHRGSLTGQTVDDLFAHKGADMYVYINNNGSTPQFEKSGNVVLVYKPPYCTVCVPSGSGLPAYNSADWSDVSQILAPDPGILYGTSSNPAPADLLTVENGELWFYQGGYGPSIMGGAVLLGSTGWSGMTLIAPGTVSGQLELWARDNATGVIYSYPLTMDSNGVPSLDGGGAPVTATSGTVVSGVTLPAATYPMVRSPGPLNNSSYPGLYAEDTSGDLWYYPGQSTSGGASPLTGSRVLAGHMATP